MDCGIGESVDASVSDDVTGDQGNFECNICFELPQEPIVTLCGHLYCWPCLFQWLRVHSHSHECPICKAIVHEEKLVPIFGRGKPNYDPRCRPIPGISVPNQPTGPRPQTTPYVIANSIQENDLDPMLRFMPMAAARFGHATLSTLFGALPSIFNPQFHGYHDATVYGTTSGVPDLFPLSIHGDFVHSFHQHRHHLHPIEWKPSAWKFILAAVGVIILLHLVL